MKKIMIVQEQWEYEIETNDPHPGGFHGLALAQHRKSHQRDWF